MGTRPSTSPIVHSASSSRAFTTGPRRTSAGRCRSAARTPSCSTSAASRDTRRGASPRQLLTSRPRCSSSPWRSSCRTPSTTWASPTQTWASISSQYPSTTGPSNTALSGRTTSTSAPRACRSLASTSGRCTTSHASSTCSLPMRAPCFAGRSASRREACTRRQQRTSRPRRSLHPMTRGSSSITARFTVLRAFLWGLAVMRTQILQWYSLCTIVEA
mmetsp:Transcript_96644/g.268679  ORF Transcript_96644/g.268679 Transcript_96644/m.268679 type:complete len:217 (+) Transcript_96644:1036-1686(+)